MQLSTAFRRRSSPLLVLVATVAAATVGGIALGQVDDETSPLRAVGQGLVYEITDATARLFPGPRFDTDRLREPFDDEEFRRATVSNSFRVRRGIVGDERPDRMRIVARANEKDIDPVMVGSGIVDMPRGIEAELAKNVRGQRVVGRKVRTVFRAKGGNYRVGTRVRVSTDVILGTPSEQPAGPASMLSLPAPPSVSSSPPRPQEAPTLPTSAPPGTRQVGVLKSSVEEADLQPDDAGFSAPLETFQALDGDTPFIDVDSEGQVSVIYQVEAEGSGADSAQSMDVNFGMMTDDTFMPVAEKQAEFEQGVAKVLAQFAMELFVGVEFFGVRAEVVADDAPELDFHELVIIILADESSPEEAR